MVGKWVVTLGGVACLVITGCGRGVVKMQPTTKQTPLGPVTYLRSTNPDEAFEKVIDKNDLMVVNASGSNLPQRYRHLIDAFGKISMGCTATHLGGGLAITAGHCFEATPERTSSHSCQSISVNWGYRAGKAAALESHCTKILAMQTNEDLDYAIFKVFPIPTAKVDVSLEKREIVGSKITIFGHPMSRPLEWSQYCVIEPASKGEWGRSQFSHQCDTEPGNSGSSVLDDATLKIIGIHDGGVVPWNYGTFITDTPLKEFLNVSKAFDESEDLLQE